MKKSKRSFSETIKALFKNKIFLICAAVVLAAAIAVLVICLVTGNGANGNSATEDEIATSFVVEDENAYIFAQGIFIGSADIGNVSYAQAREIAQKEAEKLIKTTAVKVIGAFGTADDLNELKSLVETSPDKDAIIQEIDKQLKDK